MAWTSGKEVPEVSDSAPTPLKVLVRLSRMEKPRVQRHFPSRGTSSPRVRLAPRPFLPPIKRNRTLRPPDQLITNQLVKCRKLFSNQRLARTPRDMRTRHERSGHRFQCTPNRLGFRTD